MADYYVSLAGNDTTGTGAIGNPWRSLKKGVQSLSASGGDTLYIRGGTYTGSDDVIDAQSNTVVDGVSTGWGTTYAGMNTVTVYAGETVEIKPTGKTAIKLDGRAVSYFQVLGGSGTLKINMVNAGNNSGITVKHASHHIRLIDIEVDGAAITSGGFNSTNGVAIGTSTPDYGSGIPVCHHIYLTRVRSHHCYGDHSTINSAYGFYVSHVEDMVLDDIESDHNWGFGLHFYAFSGAGSVTNRITLKNSYVHDNSVGGGGTQNGGATFGNGVDCLIFNNIFARNAIGLWLYTESQNAGVFGNLFIDNTYSAIFTQYYSAASTFRNNAYCGNGTNDVDDFGGTGTHVKSNNVTVSSGSRSSYWVNPSSDDFHLLSTASGLRDAGVYVSSVLTDADGVTRDTISPDVGPFEYAAGSSHTPTIYYVSNSGSDSNDGLTLSTPWQHLNKVAGLQAGDTLYIRGGTYTGASNVMDALGAGVPSGSSPAHITVQGYASETVTIRPPDGSPAIRLSGNSYIDFLDLTVDMVNNANTSVAGLIVGTSSSHSTFARVRLKNNVGPGAVLYQFSDLAFSSCWVHDNDNYGIYAYGVSSNDNDRLTLDGVEFYANGQHAVIYAQGDDGLFRNCTVWGNDAGFMVYTGTRACRVYNNAFYNNTNEAVLVQYCTTGPLVKNNAFKSNGTNISDPGTLATTSNSYTGSDSIATIWNNAAIGDFTLPTGSPLIGAGTPLADVVTDRNGVTRDVSTPAIGPYEFVPTSVSASPSASVSHSPSRSPSPSASHSPSSSASPSASPSPSSPALADFSVSFEVFGLDTDPDAPDVPDWIPVDDISVDQGVIHSRGINGTNPTDVLAGSGELTAAAFNDVDNSVATRGAYSIGSPSARLGWTDGAPARIVYTYGGVDYIGWRGKLADADPDTNYDDEQLAHFVAYDHQHDLVEADIVEIDGQYGQTDAALINTLLDTVPVDSQPPGRDIDTFLEVVEFALYDVRPNTKCATALKDVLLSGLWAGGCDREGTFRAINRSTRFTSAPIGSLDSTKLTGLRAGTRRDDRANCVKCGYHPLLEDDTDVVLFSQDNAFYVGPGEIYEDFTPYRNPDQASQTIGKRSTVAVVAGTDWVANSQEDGAGIVLTANLTTTRYDFATYAKWSFDNTGNALGAWITSRQVRGKGIYDEIQPFVQSDSAKPYGRKVYPVDLKYQGNCKIATGIAELIRSQLETVGVQSARAEFLANESDELMMLALTAEFGDTINITNENTGLVMYVMEIRRIEHEIQHGNLLWVRWDLALSTDLTQTPAAPTGLTVEAYSDTQLLVNWTNAETTQTELLVDGVVNATVAPGVSVAILGGLTRATDVSVTARHVKYALIRSAETAAMIGRPRVFATGGIESDVVVGGITYHQHIFYSSAAFQRIKEGRISRMLVGGGGGGGGSDAIFIAGGGAGSGEVVPIIDNFEPVGTDPVTIGAGGAGAIANVDDTGDEGGDTTYRFDTALGGGAGGSQKGASAKNGTSRGTGGGGAAEDGTGGVGNLGGDGGAGGAAGSGYRTGGGGGGASGANGSNGVTGGTGSAVGGPGGAAVTFWGFTVGLGGRGGGPAGGSGEDGVNPGDGGNGGLNFGDGGDGANGMAVFRYPI